MSEHKEDSKKIVKNTLMLYVRMFITMIVGLFTSRVILNVLGIDNYGIYNVVAGVVTMFVFISGSLSAAISRFITYELGKGYSKKLALIFSSSVNVMIVIAVIMSILIGVVGGWFLNNELNIPEDRMYAANWVLFFSILSFAIDLINVPYNAAIIAHERMGVFAYFSILETFLKLIIVYMLYLSPIDKLITYAFLFCCISIIMRVCYGIYCTKNFKECKYEFVIDRGLLKEMGSFAGWNMAGSAAYIFNTQGINMLINIYFGVVLNAARGVATQVEGIIKRFVTNFTTALNPQIIKSYAAGDYEYMETLVCRGAKYSYMLMLFFAIPICFETGLILKLWLKLVPDYAPLFVRLTLIGAMADLLGNSSANACWATGNVKKYYIYVASWGCLPFLLTWIGFKFGLPVYWAYIFFILVYTVLIFIKIKILSGLVEFSISRFFKEVIIRISAVTILAVIPPTIICMTLPESIIRLILIVCVCTLFTPLSIYLFGVENSERGIVKKKVSTLISKFRKR